MNIDAGEMDMNLMSNFQLWEKKVLKDVFLGCAVITGAADNEVLSSKLPLVGRGSKVTDRHPGEIKVTVATYDDLNST